MASGGITTVVAPVAAKGEMGMEAGLSSDDSFGECNVRIWKYENEKLRRCENEEMQELQHRHICPNHDLRNGWDNEAVRTPLLHYGTVTGWPMRRRA